MLDGACTWSKFTTKAQYARDKISRDTKLLKGCWMNDLTRFLNAIGLSSRSSILGKSELGVP